MQCEFCNKEFSSKGNLVVHQSSAKYCLILQGKTNSNFKCEHCAKTFNYSHNLNEHLNSCKDKKKKENDEKEENIKKIQEENISLKTKNTENRKKIKQLEEKNEDLQDKVSTIGLEKDIYHEEKIKERNDYIAKLEANIEKLEARLEKFEDTVTSIVISKEKKCQQTTTNNTTNNIVINALNLNDIPKISSFLEEKLDKDVLAGGQKGLAVLVSSIMLKDKYKCVDASRQNFEFINELGEVERDVKAKKLTNALIKSEICSKAGDKGIKLWTREDGTTDRLRHDAFSANVLELINFDRDNSIFRSELTTLTS